MLGLTLRKEFQGRRLKGTAIELANEKNTGATQVPASEFLEITYPSGDLLKAIEAVGPDQGRPLVLIGERGLGKSHLMAALYHALTDADTTKAWLETWADRLGSPKIASLPLRSGMKVISESLHRQRYKFLWDIFFDNHPHGQFIRGKWEGLGEKKTDVPPDTLVLELLRKQPVALLLDEFQTWFDGLTNTKQYPWRNWAFNFIQVLSEIAKEHPDLLVLVVSVRNGTTDAYQQIHRVNPVQVDFKGPHAERDRRRLLLHRLFENRLHVVPEDIEQLMAVHVSEYLRLAKVPPAEHARKKRDFLEMWPFSPLLMQLLEDQVLVATDAQETRDLIRILADLFKSHGEASPILTAADFRLDEDSSGIVALLDSVANQHHAALREKAQRNLTAVLEAVSSPKATVPHLAEIVGALWLRSLAIGNLAGAEPTTLHLDITRDKPVDDNAFEVELATIVDNSFNIHPLGDRLVFREEENPQAKLMAFARNDRLFTDGADFAQLAREIRYVLGGTEDVARAFRVIVLPRTWLTDPWTGLDESEHPDRWDDRLPIIVLPEEPDKPDERLGYWLRDHVQRRRNIVRFLLPRSGSTNVYFDRDLLVLARAVLKAEEWRSQSPEYGRLQKKYESDLRGIIKLRFDRFAVLRTWNFTDPSRCKFPGESLKAHGSQIPEAIEECLQDDVFVPEDFEELVLAAAQNNDSVGKLLRELQEPRPNEEDCLPWLGETLMKEKIIRLCARGKIAINLRGMEYLQAAPGEDAENAWRRMRGRLGTGKHLDETYVLLPQAVPQAHGVNKEQTDGGTPLFPSTGGPTVSPAAPSGSQVAEGPISPPLPEAIGGASLFGGSSAARLVPYSTPATSGLNLIGKIEGWGIGPATSLREVTLKVSAASGAQLQKLIRGLPDGMTYELNLQKEEG
jgi:hypothetical protein